MSFSNAAYQTAKCDLSEVLGKSKGRLLDNLCTVLGLFVIDWSINNVVMF